MKKNSFSLKSKRFPFIIIGVVIIIIIVLLFILRKDDEVYKKRLDEISQMKVFENDSVFKEGELIIQKIQDKQAAVKEITNFYKSWANYSYNLGKVDSCVLLIEKALNQKPNDPLLLTKYGFYLFHKGNNDEALSNWKKVIDIDPTYTQPYVNLITYYLRESFNVDSLHRYVNLLRKIDPNYPISKLVLDTLKFYKKIN